jgi:hypothetical protein
VAVTAVEPLPPLSVGSVEVQVKGVEVVDPLEPTVTVYSTPSAWPVNAEVEVEVERGVVVPEVCFQDPV